MTDSEIIDWAADRMVNIYHESPNVDFVLRLRRAAENAREMRERLSYIEQRLSVDDLSAHIVEARRVASVGLMHLERS